MRYGVGITTRNRPEVLKTCLDHFTKFSISEATFVIVDDKSDTHLENDEIIANFVKNNKNYNVLHRRSSERLGISKAKNGCLAPLKEHDHVFLFDDDTWPISNDWADNWARCSETTGVHHSMFNCDITRNGEGFYRVVSHYQQDNEVLCGWSNCFGVALHFTKIGLQAIGGYDTVNAQNVYGYEHAQISKRALLSGITKGLTYPSPQNVDKWIYSFDLSYCWLGLTPPIIADWFNRFSSSVTQDEASKVENNAKMMVSTDVYIPIIDPFGEY